MQFTMTHFLRSTLLMSLLAAMSAHAEHDATGDDGREVLLKDNGTWIYKNEDRFATTETGSRVRLKDDGSWEFIQNKEIATPKVYSESNLNVELGDVIIHTQKTPIPNSNNFRMETQTELTVNVMLSEVSKSSVQVDTSDLSLFVVTDDKGTAYKVLSVTPASQTLQPGNTYAFVVLVDKAPKHGLFSLGGRIKSLNILIDKSIFGTQADIELHRSTDKIEEIVNQD